MENTAKWVVIALNVVALTGWAETNQVSVDVQVGPAPGTKETLTVIQPGPEGALRVLQKETTADGAPAPAARAPTSATDETPRKARLMVVPAIFAKDTRSKCERELSEKFQLSDPSVFENPGYTGHLIDALVNSRKFDVLERESLPPVVKELEFGESSYADIMRVVKVGRMLNADYVVIPEIQYLHVMAEDREVPYVGKTEKKLFGKLATNLRVVEVSTSRIVASHIATTENRERVQRKEGETVAVRVKDFVNALYGEASVKETAAVIDGAYPIKVVAVAEGTCVINRGRGAIEVGETLNVFKPGETLTDPDTKENLGYHEARVGRIKITQVDEKTSAAEIVDGAGAIEKLNICRREKKAEAPAAPAPKID